MVNSKAAPGSQNPISLDPSDTTPLSKDSTEYPLDSGDSIPAADERHYNNMALDIMDKFVGPMPVHEFFKEFVPEAPASRPTSKLAFSGESALNNEDQLIKTIHESGLCPGLLFKNTTRTVGTPGLAVKPDISVFPGSLPGAGSD
ncbi:hypothetical protein BC834DRAFT_211915 [Gloeopeniophorella convolvens]|nr:hypothetical protein BC834DRAFT_211915 [Gloeopeniophorella convolvens]